MVKRPSSSAMPIRPRQHEQEVESRRAFEAFAPAGWDVRPRLGPEYGIDLDVEIFRENEATGAVFAVQLKDTEDAGPIPRVKISLTTLRYWQAHDGLVLLVLWDTATGSGWYIWSHHIDTRNLRPDQKTLTVRMPLRNRLLPSAHAALEREVFAKRAWRTSYQELPFHVRCVGRGSVSGVAAGNVVRRARILLAEFDGILRTTGPQGEIFVSVQVEDGEIRAEIAGGATSSFGYPAVSKSKLPANTDLLIEQLAHDAAFAVALQLFRINLNEPAAVITERVWRFSSMARTTAMGMAVSILTSAGRVAEAFELVRAVGTGFPDLAAVLAALTLRSVPTPQAEVAARSVAAWAETMAAEGHPDAAIQFYNASLAVQVESSAELTVQLLDTAAHLDNQYRGRAEWWRRRGAALFFSGSYAESVDAYAEAVALGDADARVLRGDALLFAGRYAEGIEILDQAADHSATRHAEWRLKIRCLPRLLELLGITSQIRDDFVAERRFAEIEEFTVEACLHALAADALYPPALYALAELLGKEGCPDLELAVCAALSDQANPYTWLLAMHCAPITERELHQDILVTARRLAGDAIIATLYDAEPWTDLSMHELIFDGLPDDEPFDAVAFDLPDAAE